MRMFFAPAPKIVRGATGSGRPDNSCALYFFAAPVYRPLCLPMKLREAPGEAKRLRS